MSKDLEFVLFLGTV